MLFLVVSNPRPERPSAVRDSRRAFWTWVAELKTQGTVRFCHPRVGRGAAALVDVPDNDALHRLLSEWSEHVPVSFEVFPLLEHAGDAT